MSISVALKNAYLDGITWSQVSYHSDFPGSTGANELTGGGYGRMTPTMSAASGGTRTLSSAVSSTVAVGANVAWVGWWGPSSVFYEATPNGGATPKNFVSLASNDTAYLPGHGYTDTQTIVFYAGTPPGGLTEGTIYYVRDATTDTFKIAATSGGTAIDLTSAAPFACVVCAIAVQSYPAGGTHNLTTASKTFPA